MIRRRGQAWKGRNVLERFTHGLSARKKGTGTRPTGWLPEIQVPSGAVSQSPFPAPFPIRVQSALTFMRR